MISGDAGSPERKSFYPKEENLGRNCEFWGVHSTPKCDFPKIQLQGRTSCEGIIDDVCLFIKNGREPLSLTEEQQTELKTRMPSLGPKWYLPPGETI